MTAATTAPDTRQDGRPGHPPQAGTVLPPLAACGSSLEADGILPVHGFLRSGDGRHCLIMRPSGHLVLTATDDGTVLWQAEGRPGCHLHLARSGQIRLVGPDGTIHWSAPDAAPGVISTAITAGFGEDGHLVIADNLGHTIWSSAPGGARPPDHRHAAANRSRQAAPGPGPAPTPEDHMALILHAMGTAAPGQPFASLTLQADDLASLVLDDGKTIPGITPWIRQDTQPPTATLYLGDNPKNRVTVQITPETDTTFKVGKSP